MDIASIPAAILAGGLGTRLQTVVADRPKVLARVGDRPFASHLLDWLEAAGLRDVVLLTGHRALQVEKELGESHGSLELRYSPEATPLGTGGAIRAALPLLHAPRLLVLNGDSFCDVDLPAFLERHGECQAPVSILLARADDTSRYGRARLGTDGRIKRFEEKQAAAGPGWINAGIYLLERALAAEIPANRPVSLEREMLPLWAGQGRLFGYPSAARLLDIGCPASYAAADEFLASTWFGRIAS